MGAAQTGLFRAVVQFVTFSNGIERHQHPRRFVSQQRGRAVNQSLAGVIGP